jgi:hypothetical protein
LIHQSINPGLSDVEPWPQPVDAQSLLCDIAEVLKRFVVLPQWGAETLALWALHTYAYQLRDITTYIGLESPEKRCGKTTLLAVLSELVHRPVVAANISPPAFFRVIQVMQPTLLIDEADTFLQGNDELGGILNSGYSRKTAYVMRVDHGLSVPHFALRTPHSADAGTPHSALPTPHSREGIASFSCWCPKVMAAIGRLPDTLADRCIVIRMQRKTPHEQCERLRNLQAGALRQQCARFVLDHRAQIAEARPGIPESLNDRAADIWEPLLALADLAGGSWPELARQAAVSLTATTQENNPIGSLLLDIFVSFAAAKADRLFTRDLLNRLNSFMGRPWAEMHRGKEITDRWLARQLRPYGVRTRTVWLGETHAKGYFQADFMEVFRRYIPKSEVEALRAEWKQESESVPQAERADSPAA